MNAGYRRTVSRWYRSHRWQRLRASVLHRQPMCQCPECGGVKLVGEIVDHIEPHRGNPRLFWDRNNLQTMSKRCHDSWKQRMEGGRTWATKGCDERGLPRDPSDPWHDYAVNL